jgi:SAM-dependent methyltransferase
VSLEADFWGPCNNTWVEETKQFMYMELMGFQRTPIWRTTHSFDMGGRSVIDIGGGPCSILLKCENLGDAMVIDPGEWPAWVRARYDAARITFAQVNGEDAAPFGKTFDLALVYNCLQHTLDPAQVIARAVSIVGVLGLRIFEWIDIPPHDGHPHELKADLLNEWAGREGRIVELNGANECYGRAWVLGAPPEPAAVGARRSRIVLGGA